VERLLKFHKGLHPKWRRSLEERLVKEFRIVQDRRIGGLSPGEHRKLMILLAFCQNPDLLVIDEVAMGLDVAARRLVLGLLGDYLSCDGKTLILSTHVVQDAEKIASHVAILKEGKLIEEASVDTLKETVVRIRFPGEFLVDLVSLWEPEDVLLEEGRGGTRVLTLRNFTPEKKTRLERVTEGRGEVLDLSLEEILLSHVPSESTDTDEEGPWES